MSVAPHSIKVVIERRRLSGSQSDVVLQLIATVYIDGEGFSVYAPAKAKGDALQWLDHWSIRSPSMDNPFGSHRSYSMETMLAKKAAKEELEKQESPVQADQTSGPSDFYYHVRIHTRKAPKVEVKFDLTRIDLEEKILRPYQNLRPIVIGGRTILIGDVERLEVYRSLQSSETFSEFAPSLARSGALDWRFSNTQIVDITDELVLTPTHSVIPSNFDAIDLICLKFHSIARQLRDRYSNRETLDVGDEYDVQDLMHALLKMFFEDVRPEAWTPNYAGKSGRMDFLLPEQEAVIETKKTRKGLGASKLGDELLVDIGRYQSYPGIKLLVCFVYDPDGHIANPRGIEKDLSKSHGGLEVKVIITPKDQ